MNSGDVVAAVVGGASGHRKHGVVGDTVNLAARLEAAARPGTVVIGEATYRRLAGGCGRGAGAADHVKGKREPVDAYVLLELADVVALSLRNRVAPTGWRPSAHLSMTARLATLTADGTPLAAGSIVAGFRIMGTIGGGATAAARVSRRGHGRAPGRAEGARPELGADERFRQRFLRESQLAASLDHPNIVATIASARTTAGSTWRWS